MRLVICDDEKDILELLAPAFERRGVEVLCASTGKSALEFVESCEPDAVLSDLRMPDGTGIELLRRIRRLNKESPKQIRAFVMTGYLEGGEGYLKALGVERFWIKPFVVREVVDAIIGCLS